jgi:Protein of unknown function (DUF1559)
MSKDFYPDPDFGSAVRKRSVRERFVVIEILAVVSTIAFVLLLAIDSGVYHCNWPKMRRVQCESNLHQIVLALRMYEEEYKTLPPAYTVDAQGRPLHSWRTLILPYLDSYDPDFESSKDFYATINLSKPWNDPANATAQTRSVGAFHCPEGRGLRNATNYLAIVADNGCLLRTKPRPLADITDDQHSTLMVIEVDDEKAVPWMAPTDADEWLVLNLGTPQSNLHHAGIINAGFVDGSIRSLKANAKPDVLRALMSISGGEKMPDF